MPVRVVAGDASSQPDYLGCAQVIGERALHLAARDARITYLHVGQQAFLRGQQSPRPVDIDRTAFEYSAGLPTSHIEMRRDGPRNSGIDRIIVVLGPAVEFPLSSRNLAAAVVDE